VRLHAPEGSLKVMKRILWISLLVFVLAAGASAAITVTGPSAQVNVKSCNEFSTDVLRDKWDMSQRTDLGWRIFNTVELPQSYLTNISFAGGIFSAKTVFTPGGSATNSDCNISILDSHYPGSVPSGKVGTAYPIDANKYQVLVIRGSFDPSAEGSLGILYWSKNTIYSGVSWSNPVDIYRGWAYYYFDIPAIRRLGGTDDWNGTVDSLRFDPIYEKDRTLQIDWIRLVEKDAALQQTVSWTGNTGNVDIYLDDNSNPGDGTLGLLAKNKSGTSFAFLTGGLEAGDYYAVVVPAGTSPTAGSAVSPGFYRVNDTPVVSFTKPTAEGSTEDFATAIFNDPWDMANLQDIEYTHGIAGGTFTTLSYRDQVGTLFSDRSVYRGTSTAITPPAVGDPYINFLYWDQYSRGRNRKINADRYHNLVATFGIAGAWNVLNGSIARVVWKRDGETTENVSDDIIIRHLNDNSVDWGQTVLNKIVFNLKTLPLDPAGSPSTSGWAGLVDGFRIDPHEFASPRELYVDDVKITADWRADTSFPITWTVAHTGSATTVNVYYDTNASGYDGTLIAAGLTGTNTTWNCTAVPEGTYWIYATYTDGTNGGQCYAGGPVIVEHHTLPQIRLSRYVLNFGSVHGGQTTSAAQVALSNAGSGTLIWSVAIRPDTPFLKVSPMSGTGNAALTIWIDPATLPASGPFWGTVTVSDSNAFNSPQIIEVWGEVYAAGASAAPFGDFATPINGTTGITGAIPVTGWVLDDIEVKRVEIWRDPVLTAGEVNSLYYIGDAIFVDGARPDVEDDYPAYPLNTRAGWGYMLLTNFLPNHGNGTYVLYAIATDAEGHAVTLGTKTIACDNANAVKPFGTIDTPAQGGTIGGSSYVNFGWVLTPFPKTVPKNGSTITVYVDSVLIGNLSTYPNVYDQYRSDVAGNFPGLNNSSGPVGAFYLDTTNYLNGVHSIYWIAYDDDAAGDGIGSRYFTIANAAGSPIAPDPAAGLPVDESGRLRISLAPEKERTETAADGPRLRPAPLKPRKDDAGPVMVEVEELGFVELRFRPDGAAIKAAASAAGEAPRFIGWGRDVSRTLPTGSTLDPATGIFSWLPGPGFLGDHILHFALADGEKKSRPIEVVVHIVPKKFAR
jgi:hypothetical protein